MLSLQRRRHLAELADRHDVLVIEDDPYGAIRFDEPVLPPVAAFTTRSVRLGSTSKAISPGLRVGWAVAEPNLIDDLVRAKQAVDLNTGALSQYLVADLLARPGWMHERRRVLGDWYRRRADVFVDVVEAQPALGTTRRPRGGLFCWLEFDPDGPTATELLDVAVDHGVAFVPEAAFRTGASPDHGARCSFATLDDDDLVEATSRLAAAVVDGAGQAARRRVEHVG